MINDEKNVQKTKLELLKEKWPVIARLETEIRDKFYSDTKTAIIKSRMLGELMLKEILKENSQIEIKKIENNSFNENIKLLRQQDFINLNNEEDNSIINIFDRIKFRGNDAIHYEYYSIQSAEELLNYAHKIETWMIQTGIQWDFEEKFKMPKEIKTSEGKLKEMTGLIKKIIKKNKTIEKSHTMNFSKRIQQLRRESGIDLEVLAQKTGIDVSILEEYEKNDDLENKNTDVLKAISKCFGVSMDYLLCRTEYTNIYKSKTKNIKPVKKSEKIKYLINKTNVMQSDTKIKMNEILKMTELLEKENKEIPIILLLQSAECLNCSLEFLLGNTDRCVMKKKEKMILDTDIHMNNRETIPLQENINLENVKAIEESSNFQFLEQFNSELAIKAKLAEKNLYSDNNSTLITMRDYVKIFIAEVLKEHNIRIPRQNNLLMKTLKENAYIIFSRQEKRNIIKHIELLNSIGNEGVHNAQDEIEYAKEALKTSFELALWYTQKYKDKSFKSKEFEMPQQIDSIGCKIESKKNVLNEIHDELGGTLGERIQKLRLQEGLSVTNLAEKLNIRTDILISYENTVNFKNNNTRIIDLDRIAEYFKVSIDYLFCRTDVIDINNEKNKENRKISIGEKINVLRTQNDLTPKELAQKIGIDRSSICRYEDNKSKPTLEILFKIAEYFNLSIDYLLDRTDNKEIIGYKEIQQEYNNTPGDRLRSLIKETGKSNAQCEKEMGFRFNNYLKNMVLLWKPEILHKFVKYFNCSADYILCRTDIREINKSKDMDKEPIIKGLLGIRLKSIREELGLTKKELEKIGIKRTLLELYENDSNPSLINLKKLADLYNCSIDYLIGITNEKLLYQDKKLKNNNLGIEETYRKIAKENQILAGRLKAVREYKKISVDDMCGFLEISETTYRNYELNTFNPRAHGLMIIADIFGCSMDYLLCKTKEYNINKENTKVAKEQSQKTLGMVMRKLREEHKLSKKEMAKNLNVADRTIDYYEKDSYYPSLDVLFSISEKFNSSIDYLCGRTPRKETYEQMKQNQEKMWGKDIVNSIKNNSASIKTDKMKNTSMKKNIEEKNIEEKTQPTNNTYFER